jgi:hypothetical protein
MSRLPSGCSERVLIAEAVHRIADGSGDHARNDLRRAYVRSNDAIYQRMLERIAETQRTNDTEKTIAAIGAAASFATGFHGGRFSDGALENLLLNIGRTKIEFEPLCERPRPSGGPLRVLHVATQVLEVGGHTRMLHRWIAEDSDNEHSIALTRQERTPIPDWLLRDVRLSDGHLLVLDQSETYCHNASRLRSYAYSLADLVVIHHSGADVIPTLAFSADGGPSVAILNHADHSFWLGSSVADICIDLRSITREFTVRRRYVPRTALLPIPLTSPINNIDRTAQRRELCLEADDVMLLTVARAIKFRPCAGQNFMATVENLLNADSRLHLYVIGETPEGMAHQLGRSVHPRIHCVGTVVDTTGYRAACDIYIESFPFGSNTSLLEAALFGIPVVPACKPLTNLLIAHNDSLEDILDNPASEDEYCARIRTLARDPDTRRAFGHTLRGRLLKHHVGPAWKMHLNRVYESAAALLHQPKPIPVTNCETTDDDVGLGLFNAMADGRSHHGDPISRLANLRHSAFAAKYVGDFGMARSFSLSALRIDALGSQTWRLFLASLVGPLARLASTLWRSDGKSA